MTKINLEQLSAEVTFLESHAIAVREGHIIDNWTPEEWKRYRHLKNTYMHYKRIRDEKDRKYKSKRINFQKIRRYNDSGAII